MWITVRCPGCGYEFEWNVEADPIDAEYCLKDNEKVVVDIECPNCGHAIEYKLSDDEMDSFLDKVSNEYGDALHKHYSKDEVYKRLRKYLRDRRKLKLLWTKYLEDEDYQYISDDDMIKILELAVSVKTGRSIEELNDKDGWKEIDKLEEMLLDGSEQEF